PPAPPPFPYTTLFRSVFGLHGGLVADRSDRRRVMVRADVTRGVVLVPIAVAGLAGRLDLWMLVVAAFVLETATSYFEPAYGALLDRKSTRLNSSHRTS